MFKPYTWAKYSEKLKRAILKPLSVGTLQIAPSGMRVVKGTSGQFRQGNLLSLYLIVDESDGVVADARFHAYGNSALIGAAEVACELVLRKNYDQAGRISADLIDRHVRDHKERPAFPDEVSSHINLVLSALEEALTQCDDIPLPVDYTPPTPFEIGGEAHCVENWEALQDNEKRQILEKVIEADIRPYIELDAGGIEIVSVNGFNVVIAYSGACTSCYSSIGSTLSAIQGIVRQKVHPSLTVTPDKSALQLSL